ncbi:MAG: protein kinase [Verrucomicrobia bacterium]|nr:protein kinase [Verrucomicrobiota bacterium]
MHPVSYKNQRVELIQKFQSGKTPQKKRNVLLEAGFKRWQLDAMEEYRKATHRQPNKTFSITKGFADCWMPYSVIATDRKELVLYFSAKGEGLLGKGKSGRVVRGLVIGSSDPERIGVQVAVKKLETKPDTEAKILSVRRELHTKEIYTRENPKTGKVRHILIQDFVEGASLVNRYSLPWEKMGPTAEKAELARAIMKDLQALHGDRVIHRDLWGDNILTYKNRAKIIDYGRSVLLERGESIKEDIGSVQSQYCSPEALKNEWSFASDVYAMAVTLFHLFPHELQAWRKTDDGKQAYDRFLNSCDARERIKILQNSLRPYLDNQGKAIADILVGMLQPEKNKRSSVEKVIGQFDDFLKKTNS